MSNNKEGKAVISMEGSSVTNQTTTGDTRHTIRKRTWWYFQ
jgi:hypothetical protein